MISLYIFVFITVFKQNNYDKITLLEGSDSLVQYKVNGVILAGGLSRRFGEHKAFAQYNRKYFYQCILQAMKNYVDVMTVVCHPIIKAKLSGNNDFLLIQDVEKYRGLGPLAGIYSAMTSVEAEWYLIFACDTPNISPYYVEKILQQRGKAQVIVPIVNEQVHPLAGLYHHSVLENVNVLLKNGNNKMKDLLQICNTMTISLDKLGVSEEELMNVNTQEEYKKLMGASSD